MNKISVESLKKEFGKDERKVKSAATKILKILKKDNIAIEIYLADDKMMRSLNRKLRGKNKVANVLSFEEPSGFIFPKSKVKKIGEIYLNDQSKDKNFSQEFLLVHGVLHLLGYDHIRGVDAIKMERAEKSVMLKI